MYSAVTSALAGRPGTYSVSVVDVATGETLVDQNGAEAGVPASSLKLLTGTAALSTLGQDARFDTSAVLDGDDVWLVGGGDVMLGAGESDDSVVNGHAGLGTLAQKTVAALERQGVTGQINVGLDSTLFPGPGLNPDWADDLVTTNNITEVQTPAMYAGRANADNHSEVVRNPASVARQTFVTRLQEAADTKGLDMTFLLGETRDGADGTEGASGDTVAKVSSATVMQQLEYMENHSDNYLAETFGRLVAVESGQTGDIEGATSSVSAAVEELGVDTTGLDMHDTSGLAATNQVSPSTLAQLLAVTQTSANANLRDLAGLLPAAGASGTLSNRLAGWDTKGLIRAKTGTLADVISLSGFVTTRDGRLLSFSVMSSHVTGVQDGARAATDAVAEALLEG
ncbi:D-alanyl-D-alanine carboxypeptidase/D-alanyl-D-alanine-endopeptidase [Galactobacter sp.]|uniref:D-alanyl-D-alanine carboxypeptidase/D-alanyl-D-alanine endopeptidase n=1 Tax=Galactobacter sp. TaxID=2676125 RepID=UPI0025BC7542|nr:D-alanyl-D-alanine carboxypeptidase/D-alanyl-D-alanine-endopeptidase [Galactobacter sp.]